MKQLEITEQKPSTAYEPARIRSCRSCPEDHDSHIDDTENLFVHDKTCPNGWQNTEVVLTPGAPWARRIYQPTIESLNDEIMDLYEWLRPTTLEISYRRQVFCNVTAIITHIWPHARCSLFGSVATNLFLPSSDIDVSVQLEPGLGIAELSPIMHTAAKAFRHSNFFENITVLDKAYVPIVKLTDKETQFNIDISFNTTRAVPTVEWIEEMKRTYPVLEPLVLVLKQFLVQRDLNQPFNGGLSSYTLIVMTVHFLKLHLERLDDRSVHKAQLGILFLGFLKFFGCDFNYANMALRIRDGASEMVSKEKLAESMHEFKHSAILCIEDPLDPENDIGRGAHNMMVVKNEFANAFYALHEAPKRLKEEFDEDQLKSYRGPLLKVIIEINPRQIQERNWLRGMSFMHPMLMNPVCGDVHNGLQNGLSFSPVLCTSVTPHQPNMIAAHQNFAPPYWDSLPLGAPNCVMQLQLASPNPPFSIPPPTVPVGLTTSNGIKKNFHGRSASFSTSRSCRSPSTSSIPTPPITSVPLVNTVSENGVQTAIQPTGIIPYPPPQLMPGIETTTVTTLRPLQSQQPIYCQTSPALNPPYCTIQPLRPTMNEITSPPIITSLQTPATIFQQHQFFAIPYLPRNNHLTSSPRDDSYAVPLRIEDVPPASSSSSISVTSEDSGVNGTLDSSNDADASGACTEENLSCGEDEETVVNVNPLSIFNEDDELEEDEQPEDLLAETSDIELFHDPTDISDIELFQDPTGISDSEDEEPEPLKSPILEFYESEDSLTSAFRNIEL